MNSVLQYSIGQNLTVHKVKDQSLIMNKYLYEFNNVPCEHDLRTDQNDK